MIYKAEDLWNKDSPYLEHKFGFKYILKLPVGKAFRYFYSQAEIAAYRAKKAAGNALKNTGKSVSNVFRPKRNAQPKSSAPRTMNAPKVPGLDHTPGTDPNGYKYVAKIKIGNKVRYFYSEDEYEAYKNRAYYEKNDPEWMKQYKKIDGPMTAEEDAVSVNPKYQGHAGSKDYYMNCQQCTFIYEMRRRGYDVEYNDKYNYSGADAGKIADTYNLYGGNAYCFDGAKTVVFHKKGGLKAPEQFKSANDFYVPSGKEFENTIKKNYPPGSRGNLAVGWKQGGAHSIVWELDKNGKVTIRDAQVSGSGHSATYNADALFKRSKYVMVTRLDNCKPTKNMRYLIQNKRNRTRLGTSENQSEIQLDSSGLRIKKLTPSNYYVRFSNTRKGA